MTTWMWRLQSQILNDINNASAIDYGFSQALLVPHCHLLKQNESEKVEQLKQAYIDRF